jgi:macrolide-specific efflux system membrane fusion protein
MSIQPLPISPQAAASGAAPAEAMPIGPAVARETARPGVAVRPRPRRGRRWAVAGALLAVVAGGAASWWHWVYSAGPAVSYATATVTRGDIEDTTTALGTLQPLEYVDVGTQVSGQLKKLYVPIGAVVKQGDLLAEIDPTVYQSRVDSDKAQLLNLRAQLSAATAQRVLADQQYQRQVKLMKARATSEDALQSARATLAATTAQIDALKAQIQNTESVLKGDQANLGYTKIRAPMSGTVVSETAKQGQTLNANQQAPIILRIADLSTMTVQTQVSEADVGRLRIGMPVYFTTLGYPDRRWTGTLRTIWPTPEIVNNVVLYDALFDVPNPTGELMTQMTAQVFFVSASAKDALLVPVGALRPVGARGAKQAGSKQDSTAAQPASATPDTSAPAAKRYAVRVLEPDGSTARRIVQVGVMNRINAQVLDGLKAGDKVVIGARGKGSAPANRQFRRSPRLG